MYTFRRGLRLGVSPCQALQALLAGGVGALAFPPVGAFLLIFVSIAWLLLLMRRGTTVEARNLGLLYGIAFASGTMYWMANLFGPGVVPLIAIVAAYFGLFGHLVALSRDMCQPKGDHRSETQAQVPRSGTEPFRAGDRLSALKRSNQSRTCSSILRALLVAVFAVAIEWFRGEGPILPFPWYAPTHALSAAPAWIASARWLGTYGLSFVVWFLLAWGAFGRRAVWLLLLVLPLSAYLLPAVPSPDQRVLLIQGEEFGALERLIRELPETPVDLVAMPELAFAVEPKMAVRHPHGPQLAATRTGATVVFGAVHGMYASDSFINIAAVIDSAGRVIGTFPKQRPVPLFKDGPPGDRCPVFPIGNGILGVAICYDFDGPLTTARLVAQGATVLVMPTTDRIRWGAIQHDHHELLQRLRAVESGRWLLRAASSGRTETIDPHGVPSIEGLDFAEEGIIVLPFGHLSERTIGSRLALFGPLALAATGVYLVLTMIGRFRRRLRE